MKLTKQQTKAHDEAMKLVDSGRPLTSAEKEFILDNYHPGASHNIGRGGIFFTPPAIAQTVATFHGGGGKVLDACAGIGALSYWLRCYSSQPIDLTCVEINPEFVRVGKRVLPEAKWICADFFHGKPKGWFDSAISNPPFGRVASIRSENFTTAHFAAMERMAEMCEMGGIVIIPDIDHSQEDRRHLQPSQSRDYLKFRELHPDWDITPCSVDMRCFEDSPWKGAPGIKPMVCDLHLRGG